MTGTDILTAQAAARPDRVALIEGNLSLTYAEFNRLANRAANAASGLALVAGDRSAGMGHNSIEGFVWGSGLRKLGVVGVPVNFRLRGAEIAHVINDSGARLLLVGPEFVPVVEAARPLLTSEPILVARGAGESPPGWLSYADLLAAAPEQEPAGADLGGSLGRSMIYTSGTTGRPKGAYRPQGAPEIAMRTIAGFGLSDSDVHLMAGPGYHSAVAVFAALANAVGGTVVIMPRFDAEQALRLIAQHRVNTTFMAPVLVQRLVDLPEEVRSRHDTSSLRQLIVAAAPCPMQLKKDAIAAFGEVLWEFYGATETGINMVLRPEEQLTRPGSCGRLLEGQEALLLDADGNPVADGTPGLLWVRNAGLAEYYNRPEATASSSRDGYFTVGDIAYRDQDGYFYICDRQVDMVISGGVNIYPAEVEATLYEHPAVSDVAVIGVPDPSWGEAVKAVVVLLPGTSAGEAELIEFCRSRMADYKSPRSIEFVAELPRDAAGKLLKRAIREPYWAGSGRSI